MLELDALQKIAEEIRLPATKRGKAGGAVAAFDKILQKLRQKSRNTVEQGRAFEDLCKFYFAKDKVHAARFSKVERYTTWARPRKQSGVLIQDTGIDLVATLRNPPKGGPKYCAIQCKFYEQGAHLTLGKLNSFLAASNIKDFAERIIVDTTGQPFSKNLQKTADRQDKPVRQVGLNRLRNSSIDWQAYLENGVTHNREPKIPREHQEDAIRDVCERFKTEDRGKMLMACATGKTYTSLKIAEKMAGKGGRVLFLAPSLALVSQAIRDWNNDASLPLLSFAVCSDSTVGKTKVDEEKDWFSPSDLEIPATTNAQALAQGIANCKAQHAENMIVVFATYQSIQRVIDAQHKHKLADFDLAICDEAHRTTGWSESAKEQSEFVKVHDAGQLRAKKRLYMTATPRIYSEGMQKKAKAEKAEVWSMDDVAKFGEVFYEISFAKAVTSNLLTDYKVVILGINKEEMSKDLAEYLENDDVEIDYAVQILGCYRALAKMDIGKADVVGKKGKKRKSKKKDALWRSLAYCKNIDISKNVTSRMFMNVAEEAQSKEGYKGKDLPKVSAQHIDGTHGAATREEALAWLAGANEEDNTCRVLCNVRCLSEGVDVPTLDAVFFMHPRKSKVDVVQSVGRVMRKAEGKELGYIILPVVVPDSKSLDEKMEEKQYEIIWKVLNALRAHDKSLDGEINAAEMGEGVHERYLEDEGIVVAHVGKHIEIVTVVKEPPSQMGEEEEDTVETGGSGKGNGEGGGEGVGEGGGEPPDAPLPGFYHGPIISKIVAHCGTRTYWPEWARKIANIAEDHILRIKMALKKPQTRAVFNDFLKEIRRDINEEVTEEDTVQMLAQHLITKPVFDALFKPTTQTADFARNNPVSQAMDKVLKKLQEANISKESESLQQFYDDIAIRVKGIQKTESKQRLVKELYDNFFRQAFPRMTQKLGIVYTPVEVVDFIIHSVNDALKQEFNQTLGGKNVNILDPFTGTGTFIVRMLESGILSRKELKEKYDGGIYANEILLLAYYVAAVNIEQAYFEATGKYKPFPGICLTDTFRLQSGKGSLGVMKDNSRRLAKQRKEKIHVILGNPPYSAGQRSENDNAKNVKYKELDEKIASDYVYHSKAKLHKSLYDSYIRAIRWASNCIEKDMGVVAFVTNAGWLDSASADGMRKCLAKEYSSLYIFNLRGNARLQGELWRKEGGKIFDAGSRAPVAINIFVKKPTAKEQGKIYYHDIGDYLSREDKLAKISAYKSIAGIKNADWQTIKPDANNDWLNQRESSFDNFVPLTGKTGKSIFALRSLGIVSSRDHWVYNSSKDKLTRNMGRMIDFYNAEIERYVAACRNSKDALDINSFVNGDPTKISWSRRLKKEFARATRAKKHGVAEKFDKGALRLGMYRPFTKRWAYFNRKFNEEVNQQPLIFPGGKMSNLVICVSSNGARTFSALATDELPDLHLLESAATCFPLRIYEPQDGGKTLLNANAQNNAVRDGVTDWALANFRKIAGNKISKKDIFYYVYGVLHAPDYREKYANNLARELPRIPLPKSAAQFSTFAEAGKTLVELHINYEKAKEHRLTMPKNPASYRVEKMRWLNKDKTELQYNDGIRITNIPPQALQYVVNGRSPVEWVAERQGVSVHKESGIQNDANHYAATTPDGEKYPLKLIARAITVAIETQKIIAALPPLLK